MRQPKGFTPTRLLPFLAMAMVLAWQWVTVHANYGGNWTALFYTGAGRPMPPLVAAEHVYVFPNSTGYDGQLYHYVAHDPLMRSDLKNYSDDARMRYRRVLVPALANLLSMGRPGWVDPAYRIVVVLGIGLGVYWSCRFAGAWGMLFILLPASLICVDRLVVDGMLAAFTAGFLVYRERPGWQLWAVLMCAALTRETGLILVAACCLHFFSRRQWRRSVLSGCSAIPAAAWYAYVQARTVPSGYRFTPVPFSALAHVIAHPWKYPASTPFVRAVLAGDYLADAGALLGIGLGLYCLVRGRGGILSLAAGLYAVLEIFQPLSHWENVYDFGRLESPMLLCLAGIAWIERNPGLLAPWALLLPRIAMQFGPQLLGIVNR
jgi:hypothetical protein